MLTGVETRWRMTVICSRAFSTEIKAQGNHPSPPPCAAAITRSASMTPAIGASTIGNSVLKSSRSRRSGHMVCSFGELGGLARASLPEATTRIALHIANELCIQGPPDAPAPQRDHRPNRLDQPERPGALQESVNRPQRAGDRKREDEPAAAILQRVTHQHRRHREQTE